MIDHVTLNVGDLERSTAFYEQALKPLGYELTMEFLDHEHYYGAYVLDPEGNNIEAVTHKPG